MYKSFPVAGVEAAGRGLKVLGKCSDGQLDHDGDIVSPSWMASAVNEWLQTYPAVRLQHRQDAPVGKGLEAWQDPDGSTWLKSIIVSPKAKKLVRSGVLSSYSVGIAEPVTKQSPRARRWEIVGGRLVEVSICDSPSNARCGIQVVAKSAGGSLEYIGKAFRVNEDAHWSVLATCTCKSCMAGRRACGCPQCSGVVKSLRKAAKLAADPGRAAEKALRTRVRAALESSDPWMRETAREVLGGQD